VPVFHCTAETRADLRGANRNARLFYGVRKSPVALSPGSAAVQVPDEIGVDPADVVLPRHHGLGPMTGTQLDSMLRNLGVTTIVGVGVSVNIGMTNFAFDAVNRGYQFVLPTDAVAGVPADYAAAVIENTLTLVATLTTTDDVIAAWS
jgi:nicotinamidase-related amidase